MATFILVAALLAGTLTVNAQQSLFAVFKLITPHVTKETNLLLNRLINKLYVIALFKNKLTLHAQSIRKLRLLNVTRGFPIVELQYDVYFNFKITVHLY